MVASFLTIRDTMLSMRGINWTLSSEENLAVESAIRTAQARLQDIAGGEALDMEDPDILDLVCNAAWYIREQRWPEFVSGYANELNLLRIREAFGCG